MSWGKNLKLTKKSEFPLVKMGNFQEIHQNPR